DRFAINCFADDTGLEIEALNGRPGVFSARYGGKAHDFIANMDKVLVELEGINNRKAQFRTVIALIIRGDEFMFEGSVQGVILNEKHGNEGFGYDPIFKPDGSNCTFAEMGLEQKNTISHRARAVSKLAAFLKKQDFGEI
ncbi:MAG: non-canonical purine NTP pyrophosphatase, partial [Bacteroidota bacterium]